MTLDLGFVPVDRPGHGGTGSIYASTILIEELSRHHDLTVYVVSPNKLDRRRLPARERIEYVVDDDLSHFPHGVLNEVRALTERRELLERHDVIHSYSSTTIAPLSRLETDTIVTLNSYTPMCPKSDLLWLGTRKCSGPAAAKCFACVSVETARRRRGILPRATTFHNRLGRIRYVGNERASVDGIDRYHAISPHLADDYVELGVPESKITVIPELYDEAFLIERSRGRVSRPDEPISILAVGRLLWAKGIQVLLDAIPLLSERGYDVELIVAGAGPYEGQLRSLSTELGVDGRVTWAGFVPYDRLPGLYDDADVFVYPGLLDEPFGRIFLEAMASGTPIVSSDVGSADYIVGSSGTLFEPGNVDALVNAFVELIDRYEVHATATSHRIEEFAPERVIDSLLDLYEETIADGE